MAATSKARMRGWKPAAVFWPEGESRFTRLPMPSPMRLASSSPMTMPGRPSLCESLAMLPRFILRSMVSTEGAVLGSMPRSTRPFTPLPAESMTSV